MIRFLYILIIIAISLFLSACFQHHQVNKINIHELMTGSITTSSNTLWAIQSFDNEGDWQGLEAAAQTMISASEKVLAGGIRQNGMPITITREWQVFSQQLLSAANDLKRAIVEKKQDNYFNASDRLYPPCEGCHNKFFIK